MLVSHDPRPAEVGLGSVFLALASLRSEPPLAIGLTTTNQHASIPFVPRKKSSSMANL